MASQRGVAVLNAAPYGSGLLAKGPAAYPRYAYTAAPADLLERAAAIADVCQMFDVPLAAAALQFSLRDSRIVSTIVGMSRPERLQQTLELAAHAIPDELWARLAEHIGASVDPEAVRWKSERHA
jgi:D-threo-aldose 1-dehydrogenase